MKKIYRKLFVFCMIFILAFGIFINQVFASITFGPSSQFTTPQDPDMDIDYLDSDNVVVVAGLDTYDSVGSVIRIGTISGSNISFGADYLWQSTDQSTYIKVATFSDTKFVIAYKDSDNAGRAIICERASGSATTISSCGSEVVFNANMTNEDALVLDVLDSTHFVISYAEGTTGQSVIGTISSGTTFSFGSTYQFSSNSVAYHINVTRLSNTRFVISYSDYGNSGAGTAIIGNVSAGNIITYGSAYVYNSGWTENIDVAGLSDTKFVTAYHDVTNSDYGMITIGEVSGASTDVIGYGPEHLMSPFYTTDIFLDSISSNLFFVTYRSDEFSTYPAAKQGSVSGTTIDFDAGGFFDGEDGGGLPNAEAITTLNSSTPIIIGTQGDNGGAWANVGQYDADPIISQFASKYMVYLLTLGALGVFGIIVMRKRGSKKKVRVKKKS